MEKKKSTAKAVKKSVKKLAAPKKTTSKKTVAKPAKKPAAKKASSKKTAKVVKTRVKKVAGVKLVSSATVRSVDEADTTTSSTVTTMKAYLDKDTGVVTMVPSSEE